MISRQQQIIDKLTDALNCTQLCVTNESHLHAGHAASDGSGESHYRVQIAGPELDVLSRVKAHQLIYKILQDEMQVIHALAIEIQSSVNS